MLLADRPLVCVEPAERGVLHRGALLSQTVERDPRRGVRGRDGLEIVAGPVLVDAPLQHRQRRAVAGRQGPGARH